MGLSEAKKRFLSLRDKCEILVRKHAFRDYPERGFSEREIVELVRTGKGRFVDNKSPQAIKGSYLFFPKDARGRECKLVLGIEILEIEGVDSAGEAILVYSAWRQL